jgi:hypothetical protein
LNATLAVQLAPAPSAPQLCETRNHVEGVTDETLIGAPVVLVIVTARVGLVVFIDWPPKSSSDGFVDGAFGDAEGMNAAVTLRAALIATTQLPVPLHAPPQPPNIDPACGVAVSITDAPEAKLSPQVLPHEMPAGTDVTVPVPDPNFETDNAYVIPGVLPLRGSATEGFSGWPVVTVSEPTRSPPADGLKVTKMVQ